MPTRGFTSPYQYFLAGIKAMLYYIKPLPVYSEREYKTVSYHYDEFPSQITDNQVVHYVSNQSHPSQSLSAINSHNAQQLAHHSQIAGTSVALTVGGRRVIISKASVSALCNDFVCNGLASSSRLTPGILNDLANQRKISIHHSEKLTGNVLKRKYAAKLAKVAISASVIAAVGDFSQFKDIIDTFFKYEYSDTITSHDTYSTHYYANDEYTVTGCFLSRTIYKKHKTRKFALFRGKFTDISYETHCYMFTFKVAQAAPYIHKYLGQ